MMDRLTRQGVRDLDGKQRNRRRVPRRAYCLHAWAHDDRRCRCDGAWTWIFGVATACRETCQKCGATR